MQKGTQENCLFVPSGQARVTLTLLARAILGNNSLVDQVELGLAGTEIFVTLVR
jgi:hypothetical protein